MQYWSLFQQLHNQLQQEVLEELSVRFFRTQVCCVVMFVKTDAQRKYEVSSTFTTFSPVVFCFLFFFRGLAADGSAKYDVDIVPIKMRRRINNVWRLKPIIPL